MKNNIIGLIIGIITGYSIYILSFKDLTTYLLESDHQKSSQLQQNFLHLKRLPITEKYNLKIEHLFITVFALASTFSNSVRCLLALCLTEFCARLGKILIYSIIIRTAVEGPLDNAYYHVGQMGDALSCAIAQQANNADLMVQSVTRPVNDALLTMTQEVKSLNGSGFSVGQAVQNLEAELELENKQPTKRSINFQNKDYASQFHQKSKNRCKSSFLKSVTECQHFLAKKHDDCLKTIKIPFISTALCAVLKADFLCDVAKIFNPICEAMPEIDNANNYNEKMGNIIKLNDKLENEKTSLKQFWKVPVKKLQDFQVTDAVKKVAETGDAVHKEIIFYQAIFKLVIDILKKITGLISLFILYSALKYQKKFMKILDFDNSVITTKLKKFDYQQAKSIFPLSGLVKKNYLDLSSGQIKRKLTYFDTRSFVSKIGNFLFMALLIVFSFSLDYVTRTTITTIRTHANDLGVNINAENSLKIHVHGTGVAANMVRKLLKGASFDIRFQASSSISECMPDLRIVNQFEHALNEKSQGMTEMHLAMGRCTYYLILLFIIIFLESTLLGKLSRPICAYFFQEREKARCEYLYYNILSRQISKQRRVLRILRRLHLAKDISIGNFGQYENEIEKFQKSSKIWRVLRIEKRPKLNCILCDVVLNTDLKNNSAPLYMGCQYCKFAWCHGCNFEFTNEKLRGCLICKEKQKIAGKIRNVNDRQQKYR